MQNTLIIKMSYSGMNVSGGISPCYAFYERLIACAKTENAPTKMCAPFGEDYFECLHKKKQVK